MDTNKMREEFEAAFIAQQVEAFGECFRAGAVYRLKRDGDFAKPPTEYDLHRREQGMYDEYWIEMLWWAWQASREAVVVELPDRPYASESDQEQMTDYEIGLGHGGCEEWDKIRDKIKAQGLKVKP